MSREDAQMKIRLPEKLRDRIVEAADANKRTLNAEIVQRLDLSFIHEMEGREGDVRSLTNEVMELRHSMIYFLHSLTANDKQGFREILDEMLAKYGVRQPVWPKDLPKAAAVDTPR